MGEQFLPRLRYSTAPRTVRCNWTFSSPFGKEPSFLFTWKRVQWLQRVHLMNWTVARDIATPPPRFYGIQTRACMGCCYSQKHHPQWIQELCPVLRVFTLSQERLQMKLQSPAQQPGKASTFLDCLSRACCMQRGPSLQQSGQETFLEARPLLQADRRNCC